MKIIKTLLFVILLSIFPAFAFAQSASDLYNAGISLMAKKDYDGAIKSFNASMAINKSEDNVKKCTDKINACKWYKSQPIPEPGPTPEPTPTPIVENKLDVSAHEVHVNSDGKTEKGEVPVVFVTATPNDWTVDPMKGEWFEIVLTSNNNKFEIWMDDNQSDSTRESLLTIKSGDKEEKVLLKQEKKIVISLGVLKEGRTLIVAGKKKESIEEITDIETDKKGEQKVYIVTSNADVKYERGSNWRIVSHPSWIIPRFQKIEGKKLVDASPDELVLDFEKLDKKQKRRHGEIVIESQGVTKSIDVYQE